MHFHLIYLLYLIVLVNILVDRIYIISMRNLNSDV